jgi:hypothetical protein
LKINSNQRLWSEFETGGSLRMFEKDRLWFFRDDEGFKKNFHKKSSQDGDYFR